MVVPLLEAKNLKKHFPVIKGLVLTKITGWIKAVDGIDFQIYPGDTFGLVGESGCGKTTTARLILLLEKITSGSLFFEGANVNDLRGEALKRYRSSVQAVFQDPYSSLNPRMRVSGIISEPIIENNPLPKVALKEKVDFLLAQVGLSPESSNLYPHEFSGGQRQRIAVARALALNPRLITLDEPVSALDVSIRAQIINLLKDLQEKFGLTFLLIAHNLATVRYLSTFVAVMYLGKIVEAAPCEELYTHPLHPYTQALLSATLPSHPSLRRKEEVLPGEVPSAFNPSSGCHFHSRCIRAFRFCSQLEPLLLPASPRHNVACHLYHAV